MRVVHFEKHLEKSIQNLKLDTTSMKTSAGDVYVAISNWEIICNTMRSLEEFDFIKPYVTDIFSLGIHFESPTPTLKLDGKGFKHFEALHTELVFALHAMHAMTQAFFPKDSESQLNIKLPDNMSLSEMSDYVREIDYIFNKMQAMRKINENNDFTLKRVDAGSTWLILFVTATAAIPLIGYIVKLGMDVKRRFIEDDIMKQRLRVSKSVADMIEKIEEEFSEELKKNCKEKAETFNSENKLGLNPEEISTLSIGIEKLGNLLFKGVEIYASLEASDTTASAFPAQEAPSLLNSAKPMLSLPKLTIEEE